MKRKEAIEKIKNLWSKDAVHVGTKAQAYQILDMMWKISGRGTKKYIDSFIDQRHDYKSSTCYSYDQDDKYCDTDTWVSYGSIKHYKKEWYTIHEASDFLGWEEEEKMIIWIDKWIEGWDMTAVAITKRKSNWDIEVLDIKQWKEAEEYIDAANLHSTVNQMWNKVDQEIHFVCWSVRTIDGITTNLIEQWRYTILTTDKAERKIHTKNVNYVIVRWDSNNTPSWMCQTLIFHFTNDNKLTRKDISDYNKLWEMIKYKCTNWDMILINNVNLNAIEEIKNN